MYRLTDPEDSEGPAPPVEAKLIKLTDIVDNGEAIRSRKRATLERMAAVEGAAFEAEGIG